MTAAALETDTDTSLYNAGIPTIFELMAKVKAEARAVGKSSRNDDQGYNFRGIDAVVNAVSPLFAKYGVIPVPELRTATYRDVTTSRGKPSREVTVECAYHFYGPRGDFITAVVPGESMDFGDKGSAKAMSVAFRIALLQVLCLPTTDADPDSFSPERAYRDDTADDATDRNPTGPTPEQIEAFDLAAKEIAGCETLPSLQKLWPDIVRRNEAGIIHNSHCAALIAARDAAATEINGSTA